MDLDPRTTVLSASGLIKDLRTIDPVVPVFTDASLVGI